MEAACHDNVKRQNAGLVVDDEPPIRRLLRTSLAVEGFLVLEAENAAAAFASIVATNPKF